MPSQAKTVESYLAELPADRRESLQKVRQVILDNLDNEFEEGMLYGMIGYYVPHSVYPAGYHCDPSKPLGYLCLAAQKNYLALHAMSLYMAPKLEAAFRQEWTARGKKLDMGKACIRFRSADDVPLEVIGNLVRKFKAREWASRCEQTIAEYRSAKQAGKSAKPAAKKPVQKSAKSSPPKKKAAKKSAAKKSTKK